jgi:CspA family cold shock protein
VEGLRHGYGNRDVVDPADRDRPYALGGQPCAEKGFGFIAQDGGGPDVFAHHADSSGFRELQEGNAVTFDVAQGQTGPRPRTSTPPDLPARASSVARP